MSREYLDVLDILDDMGHRNFKKNKQIVNNSKFLIINPRGVFTSKFIKKGKIVTNDDEVINKITDSSCELLNVNILEIQSLKTNDLIEFAENYYQITNLTNISISVEITAIMDNFNFNNESFIIADMEIIENEKLSIKFGIGYWLIKLINVNKHNKSNINVIIEYINKVLSGNNTYIKKDILKYIYGINYSYKSLTS